MPEYSLTVIDAEYSIEARGEECADYAQTVDVTQEYFLCRIAHLDPDTEGGKAWRFTRESYMNLTTYPYYLGRFECQAPENVTLKACYCPAGYFGWKCEEEQRRKCKIDVLSPNMSAGCDGEDSQEYVYSIKGYD